jgi:nitroimidazol reductase NimA-like FMN-containing flavoprotein (pyridoxamine 5'-phosphate oxidase superfamily)
MAHDYATRPLTQVRRHDRAVEDEGWIRALLHRAPIGYLATVWEGQPFLNSNLFVFDEGQQVIYMHTARVGRTRSNVDEAERFCFTVSEMGRLLPAEKAVEFSVEYAGVVVFGSAAVVTEQAEATQALQLLLDKYFNHLQPGQDYHPIAPEDLARTAVYRLSIEQWSGKQKAVAPNFPGAFHYHERPASVIVGQPMAAV